MPHCTRLTRKKLFIVKLLWSRLFGNPLGTQDRVAVRGAPPKPWPDGLDRKTRARRQETPCVNAHQGDAVSGTEADYDIGSDIMEDGI